MTTKLPPELMIPILINTRLSTSIGVCLRWNNILSKLHSNPTKNKHYWELLNNNKNINEMYSLWFYNDKKTITIEIDNNIYFEWDDNKCVLRECCESGNLLLLKWLTNTFQLVDINKINLNKTLLCLFELACEFGHLNITKYIKKTFEFNINDIKYPYNQLVFIRPCKNGHLKMVKWLINQGIHIDLTTLYVKKCMILYFCAL